MHELSGAELAGRAQKLQTHNIDKLGENEAAEAKLFPDRAPYSPKVVRKRLRLVIQESNSECETEDQLEQSGAR